MRFYTETLRRFLIWLAGPRLQPVPVRRNRR
jgi:hypothetical protein